MAKFSTLPVNSRIDEIIRMLNGHSAVINSHMQLTVGPGLVMHRGSGGSIISEMVHPQDRRRAITSGGGASSASANVFPATITDYVSLGNNQWRYSFKQRRPPVTGGVSGIWTDPSYAITGTAYNLVEVPNGADGVQGNGIDVDNLPTGFAIQPAPVGAMVLMWASQPIEAEDGVTETQYWFQYENAADGTCD